MNKVVLKTITGDVIDMIYLVQEASCTLDN